MRHAISIMLQSTAMEFLPEPGIGNRKLCSDKFGLGILCRARPLPMSSLLRLRSGNGCTCCDLVDDADIPLNETLLEIGVEYPEDMSV
jgi:hypothetical protein